MEGPLTSEVVGLTSEVGAEPLTLSPVSQLPFLPNFASQRTAEFSGFFTLALCLSFIVIFICHSPSWSSPHLLLFILWTNLVQYRVSK
jgi:hypothetical protein